MLSPPRASRRGLPEVTTAEQLSVGPATYAPRSMFDTRNLPLPRAAPAALLVAVILCLPATGSSASPPDRPPTSRAAQVRTDFPPAPRLPGSRSCGRMSTTFGAIWAGDIHVLRISCKHARKLLQRVKLGEFAPKRWRCREVGRVYEGTVLRCKRKRSAMQFNAGV